MCKVLTESQKQTIEKGRLLLESLTGDQVLLESKKDCFCCKDKKVLKEGTWAFEKEYARRAVNELKRWKEKYYKIVGDDATYDGVDSAISRIEEMIFATNK